MNNGAKLVVALVLIFAAAGLYMAFFPPGGAKKPVAPTTPTTPSTTPTVTPRTADRPAASTPPSRPTATPSTAGEPSAAGSTAAPSSAPSTSGNSGTPSPTTTGAPVGPDAATTATGTTPVTPTGSTGSPSAAGTTPGAASAPSTPTVAPVTPPPVAPAPRTSAPAPSPAREYTIIEGDTFTSIAEEYFGDRRKVVLISAANPNVDPARLAIGQRIRLPAQDTSLPASATSSESATPTTPVAPIVTEPTGTAAGRYTIQKGDTLASIADRFYGTKAESAWRRIFEANRTTIGDDPSRLRIGAALVIPPRSS